MGDKFRNKYRIASARSQCWDYGWNGAYFITIVAHARTILFGEIASGETRLNEFGRIVQDEWRKSSVIRREIELDVFVVMPNHVHGIVVINEPPPPLVRGGGSGRPPPPQLGPAPRAPLPSSR
jgi:putative transposase